MRQRQTKLGNSNLIGHKVTALRKAQKLTQKELMSQMQICGVDINYTSLSKLEGQTRIATDKELVAIARILGASPNELLEYSPEKTEKL